MGATQVHCSSVQLQPADQARKKPWWSGRTRCLKWCGAVTVTVAVIVLLAACDFWLHETTDEELRHYFIAIDSVSGFDLAMTDLGCRPTAFDPEFNLTLCIASSGIWECECAALGMYAEVYYRGVPLASTMAVTEQICAEPKKATEKAIVARGGGPTWVCAG